MAREPPSLDLFPGESLEGRPARWEDLERKKNRLKKLVQGANAQLLCAGWRLRRDQEWWVARHAVMGLEIRGLRLGDLVSRALAFQVTEKTQLGFNLG